MRRQKETAHVWKEGRRDSFFVSLGQTSLSIQYTVTREKGGYALELHSDVFAPFVELDFEDAEVLFEDNYFTLQSDEPLRIFVEEKDLLKGTFQDEKDMEKRLRIRTVRDTYA